MKNLALLSPISLALLLFAPILAAADGGTVVRATGSVNVEREGQKLPVTFNSAREIGETGKTFESPGFSVQPGDLLLTGNGSSAQLRFDDDSIFSLPGGASLRVDQFQLRQGTEGGRAIFSLTGGGFRTITGLVGKENGDLYEVRTPMATVRVAGSAYSAVICKSCIGAKGGFKDGLYIKAEKGIIIVTNNGGELRLKAGQTAFVSAQGVAAVRVKVSPFDDPKFAAGYAIDLEFDYRVNPPRIEPEPPASPS